MEIVHTTNGAVTFSYEILKVKDLILKYDALREVNKSSNKTLDFR